MNPTHDPTEAQEMTEPRKKPPTQAALRELAAAWDAYRDDDANYERLANAISAVLGRAKSAERLALDAATPVRIDELPLTDRPFGEPFDD